MSKRPLVNSQPVDEFGAVTEATEFHDPRGQGGDLMYVPGFSGMRRDRDTALGEYARGERLGQDVPILPVNVRWSRRANPRGEADAAKIMTAANSGYRPVTKKDVGAAWLTALPAGARVMGDGSIINQAGDLQLMVAEATVAARNAKRKAAANAAQVEAVGESSDGLLSAGRSIQGSAPTVTKE